MVSLFQSFHKGESKLILIYTYLHISSTLIADTIRHQIYQSQRPAIVVMETRSMHQFEFGIQNELSLKEG